MPSQPTAGLKEHLLCTEALLHLTVCGPQKKRFSSQLLQTPTKILRNNTHATVTLRKVRVTLTLDYFENRNGYGLCSRMSHAPKGKTFVRAGEGLLEVSKLEVSRIFISPLTLSRTVNNLAPHVEEVMTLTLLSAFPAPTMKA